MQLFLHNISRSQEVEGGQEEARWLGTQGLAQSIEKSPYLRRSPGL